jgi:RNA polymerase sigma factor (sigma-70 family)
MDQVSDDKNTDATWLESISLSEALKRLGEREKHILTLRFFEGKTQMEVADEIGIKHSKMQYIFRRNKDAYKGGYSFVCMVEALVAV